MKRNQFGLVFKLKLFLRISIKPCQLIRCVSTLLTQIKKSMQQSKVKKTPTRGIATAIIAGLLIPVFKLAMAFDGKGVFSGRFIFIGVTAAHFAVAAKIVWERFDDQQWPGKQSIWLFH